MIAITAPVKHAHTDIEFRMEDAILGPAVAVDG